MSEQATRPMPLKIGCYAGIGLFLVLTLFWAAVPEPSHEGTSLTQWVAKLKNRQTKEEAVRAIRAIGSDALPWLDVELRSRDSSLKLKLIQVVKKQSFIEISFTKASQRIQLALQACTVLGPVARPLIPALAEALVQGNVGAVKVLEQLGPEASLAMAHALTNAPGCSPPYATALALGRMGADARPALTNLVWEFEHSSIQYPRAASALAIAKICRQLLNEEKNSPEIRYARTALIHGLSHSNWMVRKSAAESLGTFRQYGHDAQPALEKLLHDPHQNVRTSAAKALKTIQPQAALLTSP